MKKDLIVLAVIVFIIVLLCQGVKIQSVEEYYNEHLDDITEESETVFLSIECSTILDNMEDLVSGLSAYVPVDGVIQERKELVLRDGDTVYDILLRVTRVYRIQMECIYNKNFGSIYIQGINNLYEFSCGELSGWMYSVNGIYPNYGCSRYHLKDEDEIVWSYTCDLGRDLNSSLGGA